MPVEILMPELGESVHEGTVSRWLKKIGDTVQEDEPVVEIMTDKVNTELPAPATGVLVQILIAEGDPVEVFHAMGVIEPDLEAAKSMIAAGGVPASAPAPASEAPAAATEAPTPSIVDKRKWFTPVVRAIAAEHGLSDADLEGIKGSGEGGRVTKKDVQAYIRDRASAPKVAPSAPSQPKPVIPVVAGPEQEVTRLVGLRKMIADAMERSGQVPTVTTLVEVDVTNMVAYRSRNKDAFEAQYGVRLTYTPFFVKAISDALIAFPVVNSSLQDGQVITNRAVHLGVAVALGADGQGGLIVPVLRNCEAKNLVELAKELDLIARKARNNELEVADVQGATFTLTNPGTYGAVLGTPMLNAPQAGIVGTYGIKKVPVIVDDMIAIRSIMNVVLTYDHRLVDGMVAGRFLQSIKKQLEAFEFFR